MMNVLTIFKSSIYHSTWKQFSCFFTILGTIAVSPIQFHQEMVVFSNIYPLIFKERIHPPNPLLNYKCLPSQGQFTLNGVEIASTASSWYLMEYALYTSCLKQNLLCCQEYLLGYATEHIS